MGALTSKHKRFMFRVWEPSSVIEIDDTEVAPFLLRTEYLKTYRSRILPINYWISDHKRFSKERSNSLNPSLACISRSIYRLHFTLFESKLSTYIVANIKGYRKIMDKLMSNVVGHINVLSARRFTTALPKKLRIKEHLLLNHEIVYKSVIQSFNQVDQFNQLLLFANPTVESPAFNAHLFKNQEDITFKSFSSFAFNISKEEIPLSDYNTYKALQGHCDLTNTLIVSSVFNKLPVINTSNVMLLAPIYMNRCLRPYHKYQKASTNFYLFSRPCTYFKPAFLASTFKRGFTSLYLNHATFDQFALKRIEQKVLTRLHILVSLIKADTKSNPRSITYLRSEENDISILLQTIKSV